MRFAIRHRIRYRYDREVFIGPMTIRLQPRTDAGQICEAFSIVVTPTPAGMSVNVDWDGTPSRLVWFDDLADALTVETTSMVVTTRDDPFGYLIHPLEAARIPVAYDEVSAGLLAPYRARTPDAAAAAFAREVAELKGEDVVDFLSGLCAEIRARHAVEHRDEGPPRSPSHTLAARSGACRDLTVLFMEAARSMGLAARFVSGYAMTDERTGRELHAWAEVYIPGAGWRGFDPTQGLAVAVRHVAVAAAATPEAAAPTSGAYLGTGVASTMEYDVEIDILEDTTREPETGGWDERKR